MRRITLLSFIVCIGIQLSAQNITIAKQIIDTLTSTTMWGRGYTNNGNKKAADFLRNYYKSAGLTALDGKDYFQYLSYPVNTFPKNMELTINGKVLQPGVDFIVSPESRGIKSKGDLIQKDSIVFEDVNKRVIIELKEKLTWSVATQSKDYTSIEILKTSLSETPKSYKINIDNKFNSSFKTANVCAEVKGTNQPDSFIFITAHYDHLGGMGKDTYFPGANDNASGTTLLLGLASYFVKHPQSFTIVFISFTGEEPGLIGSRYFSEHPIVPLNRIKFLFNLDLEGTGIEGVKVVNASIFKKEFALLKNINEEFKLLPAINERGKAANSDHYWFTEKGVPSFFMYTQGGIKAYHDVFDKAVTLPMDHYENLLKLLEEFVVKLQK